MKTLYYGGPIRTMESGGLAEALLVENGVIAAVGTREARAGGARRPRGRRCGGAGCAEPGGSRQLDA